MGSVGENFEYFVVGDSHTRRSKGFILGKLPEEVRRRTTVEGMGGAGVGDVTRRMREMRDKRGGWRNAIWIIQAGGNDLGRGKRFREVKGELFRLTEEVVRGGGRVGLCPLISPRGVGQRVRQWNFELGRDVLHRRMGLEGINGHREWLAGRDGVHMEEGGYEEWAFGVAAPIRNFHKNFR
jgi:lysophospholipase L1-like esterase